MLGFILGLIVLTIATASGLRLTRMEARSPSPTFVVTPVRWIIVGGTVASGVVLLTSISLMLAALAPIRDLMGVDDPVLAISVSLVGMGVGGLLLLCTRNWVIRVDPAGLYVPFFRISWDQIHRVARRGAFIYVDGEPSVWNMWSGRIVLPKAFWRISDEYLESMRTLSRRH